MIIGIVAISENYAIGKDGKLPWRYPADLKFFKETTTGHAVVMGFNTWQSIGKPLPNRLNIVLSRSRNVEPQPNVLLVQSLDELTALSNYLKGDVFIIGGAETYSNFAGLIEKWIITEVPLNIEDADTFMPKNFLVGFGITKTKQLDGELRVKIFQRG